MKESSNNRSIILTPELRMSPSYRLIEPLFPVISFSELSFVTINDTFMYVPLTDEDWHIHPHPHPSATHKQVKVGEEKSASITLQNGYCVSVSYRTVDATYSSEFYRVNIVRDGEDQSWILRECGFPNMLFCSKEGVDKVLKFIQQLSIIEESSLREIDIDDGLVEPKALEGIGSVMYVGIKGAKGNETYSPPIFKSVDAAESL